MEANTHFFHRGVVFRVEFEEHCLNYRGLLAPYRTQPGQRRRREKRSRREWRRAGMLCFRVKRNSLGSSDEGIPVAAAATAMLWRLIILPMTPPLELAAAIRSGFSPRCVAVTTCRLPNRALAEVSLPVRNTPSHPSRELKNGKVRRSRQKPARVSLLLHSNSLETPDRGPHRWSALKAPTASPS